MSTLKMSNAQINDLINQGNQEDMMKDLGYGNAWDRITEQLSMYGYVRCDEEGHELGVEDVLTPMFNDVSEISEYTEDNAVELGERIGNAELCIWSDDATEYYERDFSDVLFDVYHERISVLPISYVSREQQDTNYAFYMGKVGMAKTQADLAKVATTVIGAQKDKDKGMYFFAAGMSKVFWDAYKARKADVVHSHGLKLAELQDMIGRCRTAYQLKQCKAVVYESGLLYKDKKELWEACDQRIAALSA